MGDFDSDLSQELAKLRAEKLYRQLRRIDSPQGARLTIGARHCLNFSSNDYLGLADHPSVKAGAAEALQQFGAGSGASRLISGSLACHTRLEEALASFKGTPAALTFSSGYATAVGTICSLVGRNDIVVLDRLVHASIVDAARLSGAKLRVFAHNDLGALESILRRTTAHHADQGVSRRPRILVVTESVFSMDGDLAPLKAIVELKETYGAWLMVDEAHATGLYGEKGIGLANASGLTTRIEVQMGTLGKALGAAGGFICGSKPLVDLLINRARSFIFSTAPVPAAAGAALAAVHLVQTTTGIECRQHLWERVTQVQSGLAELGLTNQTASAGGEPGFGMSAIIPVIAGPESAALQWSTLLQEQDVYVPAIRYPTVARGAARLRISMTAAHSAEDVNQLLQALREAKLASSADSWKR